MSLIKTLLSDVETDGKKAWDFIKGAGLGNDAFRLALSGVDALVKAELPSLPVPTVEQELAAIRQLLTDHTFEGLLKALEILLGRAPIPAPAGAPVPGTPNPAPAAG